MTRLAIAAILSVLAAPAAFAANARHPYSNVDPRNDAGNDTGDSQVEALNQQQLNRGGPRPVVRAPYGYPGYGYAPPPAYYAAPPVAYAPYYPPYRYYRPYYPY